MDLVLPTGNRRSVPSSFATSFRGSVIGAFVLAAAAAAILMLSADDYQYYSSRPKNMRFLTEEDGNSTEYRPPGNPTGKKCVSISIFGSPQKVASYQAPSLRLANSISQLLPGWELHVYYEEENPPSADYFSQLNSVPNVPVELFPREMSTGRAGCFWRYESHDM